METYQGSAVLQSDLDSVRHYQFTIGEIAVTYLTDILLKQPAGIKQARMLRGVVVQARSAFRFSAGELLNLANLLLLYLQLSKSTLRLGCSNGLQKQ